MSSARSIPFLDRLGHQDPLLDRLSLGSSEDALDLADLLREVLRLIGSGQQLGIFHLTVAAATPLRIGQLFEPRKGARLCAKLDSPSASANIRLHAQDAVLVDEGVCLSDETHDFVPGPFYYLR